MPQKKYIVRLTAQEREICQQTVRKLNGSSEKVRRARFQADADGPGWTDQQCLRDFVPCRKHSPLRASRALAQTAGVAPSLKLLAANKRRTSLCVWGRPRRATFGGCWRAVSSLGVVESVATKRSGGRYEMGGKSSWVIPPEADPSSWRTWNRSWICISDPTTRIVRSCAWMSSRCNWSRKCARRWRPRRRARAASTTSTNGPARPRSSCSEPLAGWRTKADWAVEVAGLLEGRYADCPRVSLGVRQPATKGAFYEVYRRDGSSTRVRAETRELAEHRGERASAMTVRTPHRRGLHGDGVVQRHQSPNAVSTGR